MASEQELGLRQINRVKRGWKQQAGERVEGSSKTEVERAVGNQVNYMLN